MKILGYESSCDETGVAVVCTDKGLLAHGLHSQIAMHRAYGGVVPELASRDHIRRVLPLTEQVLADANLTLSDIDAIAYTAGPGLNGALLVGASFACSLAWASAIPTIPIHHLEGHLLSPLLAEPAPDFPFVALLVSGGHTQIMQVDGVGQYRLLGETLDDAAGEAFDKSAKLLGLSYPGGPALAKLAEKGNSARFKIPRPMLHSGDYNFSFSGLKTAVLTTLRKMEQQQTVVSEQDKADLAAATQEAIVDVLAIKSLRALKHSGLTRLVVSGGVGANQLLRQHLLLQAKKMGATVYFPPIDLCTDNGAMIAFAAAMRIKYGIEKAHYLPSFKVRPRWDLEEVAI